MLIFLLLKTIAFFIWPTSSYLIMPNKTFSSYLQQRGPPLHTAFLYSVLIIVLMLTSETVSLPINYSRIFLSIHSDWHLNANLKRSSNKLVMMKPKQILANICRHNSCRRRAWPFFLLHVWTFSVLGHSVIYFKSATEAGYLKPWSEEIASILTKWR